MKYTLFGILLHGHQVLVKSHDIYRIIYELAEDNSTRNYLRRVSIIYVEIFYHQIHEISYSKTSTNSNLLANKIIR